MKLRPSHLSAIASGVALGVASLAASAAEIPSLPVAGTQTGAVIRAGATLNEGASFLTEMPAGDAFDIVASVSPRAQDVGQTGSLVVVLEVEGVGLFNLLSGGIWVPFDDTNILPFKTKTLEATEEISVLTDFIGSDTNLTGATISAYAGYFVNGNINTITYSSTPASVAVAQPAADTCPINTVAAPGGAQFRGKDVCVLSGRITADTHLTSNFSYILDGAVFIGSNTAGDGARTVLTIDPGTAVFSQVGLNFLVVDRNGQIYANGSRENPVTFTYEDEASATESTTGQWGGLILNGNATVNTSALPEGEGGTGQYGGDDDSDSSGSLTFVQVLFAGQNITEENELNGIAFQATGSGTNVDYVQVHNNSDDGVEFFGGTTNAKHLYLDGNEDDALDWTFGWNGNVQFVAVKQNTASEHCIEADNNGDNNDALPRANPTIANMTCVGPETGADAGFRLREGTSVSIWNTVMTNFESYCVDIDQEATFINAGSSIAGLNGNLTMRNSLLSASCTFDEEDGDLFPVSGWYNAQTNSALGNAEVGGSSGIANGLSVNAMMPAFPSDPWFEQVPYIGAAPSDGEAFTNGWIYIND